MYYRAKEAKKGRIAHIKGHPTLGPEMLFCGKTPGVELRADGPGLIICKTCWEEEIRRDSGEAFKAQEADRAKLGPYAYAIPKDSPLLRTYEADLRDRAALAALNGELSHQPKAVLTLEMYATDAWRLADAFMAERARRLAKED